MISCTLPSALSTSKTSLLNLFTFDLNNSPSSYLIISWWSVGLFCRWLPMKWRTKELLSCSKSSMVDQASLLNHTLAAPLRVIRKDLHKISSRVCYRLSIIFKVVMWSKGSHKSSNDLSWGRWNFGDKGHFRTFMVKGESILLTIPSRFLFVFSLISFLSSSISFRMLFRRSLLALSDRFVSLEPSLLLLFSSSTFLFASRFSSYCNCNPISWFCLVSSSTLVVSVWICKACASQILRCVRLHLGIIRDKVMLSN